VESLVLMLETGVQDGVTELSCHPGYVDPGFRSGYAREREIEVRTLCDPAIRRAIAQRQIQLVSFREVLTVLSTSRSSGGSP
jgi:predicted glycoside hydrolase/deacetylase ChbG (UPF0249 family)